MEKIRATTFFIFLLIFVGLLIFFQVERFGNFTGFGTNYQDEIGKNSNQSVTFYQLIYFVILIVLLALSIKFLHHHKNLVRRMKSSKENDFDRHLIKLDFKEDY